MGYESRPVTKEGHGARLIRGGGAVLNIMVAHEEILVAAGEHDDLPIRILLDVIHQYV